MIGRVNKINDMNDIKTRLAIEHFKKFAKFET